MIVWILLLCFIILFYLICKSSAMPQKRAKKLFLFVSFLVITFIVGSRSIYHAFSDESGYYFGYKEISKMNFSVFWEKYKGSREVGFFFMNFLLSRVFKDPQTIIYVTTGISVGTVFVLIYKFCKYPLMAICVYLGCGLFMFQMTALRQTCALSLLCFASMKFYDKKAIQGVLLVVLASFFHVTALVGLIFIVVPKEQSSIKQVILYFMLFLLLVFGAEFIDSASETFGKAYDKVNNFTMLGYVIQSIILFAPIVAIDLIQLSQPKMLDPMVYFSNRTTLTGGVIYIARFISQSYERISYFFEEYVIVSYDKLVDLCLSEKDKTVVKLVVSGLMIALFLYRVGANIQFDWPI